MPEPWKSDYGHIETGDDVRLTAGPVLTQNGVRQFPDPQHPRFKYRIEDGNGNKVENPLNKRAGALTHASDNNERAAVSMNSDDSISMHALTAEGKRHLGVSMENWADAVAAAPPKKHTALNLDGGGSVNMGYVNPFGELETVARGCDPDQTPRPIVNVVLAKAKPVSKSR